MTSRSPFLSGRIGASLLGCILLLVPAKLRAASSIYPAQEVNLGYYNTVRNLNIKGTSAGSALNTWPGNGVANENWQIDWISSGVYEIVNAATGLLATASGDAATIAAKSSSDTQRWNIVGTDKDFLGNYLYYKVVNVGSGLALTFNATGNTTGLAAYTGATTQKWRLDCRGLQGFAAHAKVSSGTKAGTIGGLLGKTVFVSTVADLKTNIALTTPLTIVLTANLDFKAEGSLRMQGSKTLIGSWAANRIADIQIRTNAYGQGTNDSNSTTLGAPSDNMIIRNINFLAASNEDKILIQVYSGRNVWIDHCTFISTLPKNVGEVGKFLWVNTPYNGYDKSRSPDFVTLSYNIFRNRYWCVAYGTQNGIATEDRTSVMFNIWDSDIRRTPQIGNGSMHEYDNFFVWNTASEDNAGFASIIAGDGSQVYSESNRFEGYRKESSGYWDAELVIDAGAKIVDVGSYTNKSTSGSASTTPFALATSSSWTKTTWDPSTNYGYKRIDAYKSAGTYDVKAFCNAWTGAQTSAAKTRYVTDGDVSSYVAETVPNPFLANPAVTESDLVFTSGKSFSVPENTKSVVVCAAGSSSGKAIVYAIAGGEDSALFSLDASTGALTFKVAPDFEKPVDNGVDNIYKVIVSAYDGVSTAKQSIAVLVTDVAETVGANRRARDLVEARVAWMDLRGNLVREEMQLLDRDDPRPTMPAGLRGLHVARVRIEGESDRTLRLVSTNR